ncbi:hypothetical protein HZS_7804 [Henneguya salminicola]|nr:hypothetical protein HZS_7804 [Henneguya salminicola]
MSDSTIVLDRFLPVAKFNIDDIANGLYYESKLTGISVLVANIDGPKIDAYFCVGTRIDSDNGVAHTLEHLVFCGSKRFPYKGVLDSLANRCFAQGTNAWTCIDSTVFTISTASQEGFINILPVYIDHIFNPIICNESFSTEVYNKNDRGEEGGVVFSEMQAKENLEEPKTYKQIMKCFFTPESGYPFNSGGDLKAIRTLNIATIEEFHKKYYRPENFFIIVIGSINNYKILEEICKVFKKSISLTAYI